MNISFKLITGGQSFFNKSLQLFYYCLFFVVFFSSLLLSSFSTYASHYSFATGNTTGLYYPIGGGISLLWTKEIDNYNMKAEVTSGSLANVIQVAVAESDVAIAQGNVVIDGVNGTGRFPYNMPVSLLFTAYPNAVQILTRANSNIESIRDLKGKTVSLGEPGSGTLITALNMLESLGLSENDFNAQYLNYSETANAIRDGKIDAGVIVGGIGVSAIVELALTRNIRLLNFTDEDMDKIKELYPAYSRLIIPEGSYRNVPAVQLPVIWNVIFVHNDLDEEIAYQMTSEVFSNLDDLRRISPTLNFTTLENANPLSLPLHPGARRYYQEQCAITKHELDICNQLNEGSSILN